MFAVNARSSIAVALFLAVSSSVVLAAVGDPLPDVDVSIGKKPGGQILQQMKTDAQGNFSSDVLPKGTYVIIVRPRPVTAGAPAARSVAPSQAAPAIAGAYAARSNAGSALAQGGDERKSFFESRSNMRVTVSGGSTGPAMHTMPMAAPQEVVVEAPGGQPIRGRIVE